jgi:hypothetical protein
MEGAKAAAAKPFRAGLHGLTSSGLAVETGRILLGIAKGIVPLSVSGVIFSTQANL